MSKYTTLETSKKLYEAFPDWGDTERVYYSNGGIVDDSQTFGRNMVFAKDGNLPAYDTDYLLDKLPDFIEVSNKIYPLIMERKRAGYLDYETGRYGDVDKNGENLAEALALLALKLKKEGIL